MARYPITLGLDRYDITPRREVVEASLDLLIDAEQRQHALMTGYGGPAQYYDVVSIQTGAGSARVPVWVPPGVTYCNVGLRLNGIGDVTITTSADATGSTLTTRGDTAVAMNEHGVWTWTSGIQSSALGAASGRAVQFSATATWEWQVVEATLTFANVTTRCGVIGMMLSPIQLPV